MISQETAARQSMNNEWWACKTSNMSYIHPHEVYNAWIIRMVGNFIWICLFFLFISIFLVWLIHFKLWQKRNECISIEFFFCPFYFKSTKYVIICCFLCCSIEFRYVLLNEMMRMTGKIKLSTMKKKIFNPRYTNRSGLMRYTHISVHFTRYVIFHCAIHGQR